MHDAPFRVAHVSEIVTPAGETGRAPWRAVRMHFDIGSFGARRTGRGGRRRSWASTPKATRPRGAVLRATAASVKVATDGGRAGGTSSTWRTPPSSGGEAWRPGRRFAVGGEPGRRSRYPRGSRSTTMLSPGGRAPSRGRRRAGRPLAHDPIARPRRPAADADRRRGRRSRSPCRCRSRPRTLRIAEAAPGAPARERTAPGERQAADLVAAPRTFSGSTRTSPPSTSSAAADPDLAWVTSRRGAARPQPDRLRGGREDDLHDELRVVGDRADGGRARRAPRRAGRRRRSDGPYGRAFPTPEAMAAADEGFYRDVVRAGYRGAYLRTLAADVASGALDLEALGRPSRDDLPDDDVAERRCSRFPASGPTPPRTS